jgi:hypothetical protein
MAKPGRISMLGKLTRAAAREWPGAKVSAQAGPLLKALLGRGNFRGRTSSRTTSMKGRQTWIVKKIVLQHFFNVPLVRSTVTAAWLMKLGKARTWCGRMPYAVLGPMSVVMMG